MNNVITSTIVSAAPAAAGYTQYLNPAVEALTEREYNLTDRITSEVVRRFNVSEEQVRGQLESIGALVRPIVVPEPVVEEAPVADEAPEADLLSEDEGDKGGKKARIKALEGRVDGIDAKLDQLLAIAQRHLGVSL